MIFFIKKKKEKNDSKIIILNFKNQENKVLVTITNVSNVMNLFFKLQI